MRAKSFVFVSCLTAITGPAMAEQSQSAERALFEALMQPDVIAIMSEEGIDYAGQIADEMLMGPRLQPLNGRLQGKTWMRCWRFIQLIQVANRCF